MNLRWLILILAGLIAALQYPLWLGKGRRLNAWEGGTELTKQKQENTRLKARNSSLEAEVKDLKTGYGAIEERARSELGMVKQDEIFFQVLEDAKPAATPPPSPAAKPPVKPN